MIKKRLIIIVFTFLSVLSLQAIEYKQITVYVPGTLQQQIDAKDLFYERYLSIKGRLNSSDIKAIRHWHGGRYNYLALDMSEAEIISGGDPYFKDYTTEDDVIGPYMFYMCGFQELILPKNLKAIKDHALSGATLAESITLPESLQTIGEKAFYLCDFKKLHIPASVSSIGDGALGSPVMMTDLTVAEDNAYFEMVDSVLYTKDKTRLLLYTKHTEDSYLIAIKPYTVLPTTKKIDSRAFHGKFVGHIDLPEGLEELGEYVFYESLFYHESVERKRLVLPSTLKKIGVACFRWGNNIQELVLPDDLEVIPTEAFSFCQIQKLHLPKNLKHVMREGIGDNWIIEMTLPEGLERIDSLAFVNNDVPKLIIPKSLKVMEPYAFNYWTGDTLDIQAPLDSIPNRAFVGCQGVKRIIFPPTIKSIGDWAFTHCHELESLDLPEGLEKIGAYAFAIHTLDTIRIPSTVKELGEKALYCNTWMGRCTYFAYPKNPPVCYRFTFGDIDFENSTLYVPKGSIEAYRNAPEWCSFGNILEMDTSSIQTPSDSDESYEQSYSLSGVPINSSHKGIRVIKGHGGSVKKVLK